MFIVDASYQKSSKVAQEISYYYSHDFNVNNPHTITINGNPIAINLNDPSFYDQLVSNYGLYLSAFSYSDGSNQLKLSNLGAKARIKVQDDNGVALDANLSNPQSSVFNNTRLLSIEHWYYPDTDNVFRNHFPCTFDLKVGSSVANAADIPSYVLTSAKYNQLFNEAVSRYPDYDSALHGNSGSATYIWIELNGIICELITNDMLSFWKGAVEEQVSTLMSVQHTTGTYFVYRDKNNMRQYYPEHYLMFDANIPFAMYSEQLNRGYNGIAAYQL